MFFKYQNDLTPLYQPSEKLTKNITSALSRRKTSKRLHFVAYTNQFHMSRHVQKILRRNFVRFKAPNLRKSSSRPIEIKLDVNYNYLC